MQKEFRERRVGPETRDLEEVSKEADGTRGR